MKDIVAAKFYSEFLAPLLNRLKSAEKALQYYRHEDHYEPWESLSGHHEPGVLTDKGAAARRHFAQYEEGQF